MKHCVRTALQTPLLKCKAVKVSVKRYFKCFGFLDTPFKARGIQTTFDLKIADLDLRIKANVKL